MIFRKYLLILTIYFSGFSLLGQNVNGFVYEKGTREPLVGAHVLLTNAFSIGATTEVDGYFEFVVPDSVRSKDLKLLVRYIGYEEKVISLDELELNSDILLEPSNRELKEIAIVEDRLISEDFSVKKISRLEVYKNPAAKADPLLAVNSMASSTTLDESANISFRGTGPQRTGIFFNGVPIYDAVRFSQLNGIGTFSIFNTDLLQSVHVYPGNPPLEFGNISGGMIALETNDQVPESFQGNVLASMASSGVNLKFAVNESTGIKVFSNYQYSGPLRSLNQDALEDVKSFSSVDGGFNLIHKRADGTKYRLFQYNLMESYKVHFSSPSYNGLYDQHGIKSISIFNYLKPIGKGVLTVNSSYAYSSLNLSFSAASYKIDNQTYFTSINYQKERRKSSFKVGISYDNRTEDFAGRVPQYQFALASDHPYLDVNVANSRPLLEPYAYYKYRPSDIISFGYALRSNIPLDGMESYLSYQSSIKYDPRNPHLFRLSRSKLHQYLIDNNTLERVLIAANQISLDHEFESGQLKNINSIFLNRSDFGEDKQRVVGIETTWKYKYAKNSFVEVSYAGLDAKSIEEDENRPLKYDLDYFLRVSAQYEFNNYWTFGLRGLFRQGTYSNLVENAFYQQELDVFQPVYDQQQARLPDYNIIDFNVSRLVPVNKNLVLVLFGSVSNVIDSENVRSYSYNFDFTEMQPELFSQRTFYAGISFNFQ